jgi:hypothetical protein
VAVVWSDFAEIAGGASGALTGLLFVAVSLNRERVIAHRGLRSQAGQTLGNGVVNAWLFLTR